MTPLRRRMIDDMTLRNFTPADHPGLRPLRRPLRPLLPQSPELLGPEQVRAYLLHLVRSGTSPEPL